MQKKTSLGTYLSRAGVCSRRKADTLVRDGQVMLNGTIVREPGWEVKANDVVMYQGRKIQPENKVYILLNKPTDYLSAVSDDDRERQTVIDLVKKACSERLYPIGRLDYRTTGLIILTNDGDLAQRLAHPSFEVTKIYRAELNVAFKQSDLNRVKGGLLLDDGPMMVDEIYFDKNSPDKRHVIVSIHSGKKRVVRRLFQHIGYRVLQLDRIEYAGLTKQGLRVGQWRLLKEHEVSQLKHLGKAIRVGSGNYSRQSLQDFQSLAD